MPAITGQVKVAPRKYMTTYTDVANTTRQLFTFPSTQNQVSIRNNGISHMRIYINDRLYVITPGNVETVNGEVDEFYIESDQNGQPFQVYSTELADTMRDALASNFATRNMFAPLTFFKDYPVMATPPTVTLGAAGAASTITNAVTVGITSGTTIKSLFNFPFGEIVRADYTGPGTYSGTFLIYDFVRNRAVTTTNSSGEIAVEFGFDGLEFEHRERGQALKYRVLVDEGNGYQYVTKTLQSGPAADGQIYHRKFTFADRKRRRIRIEIMNGWVGKIVIGPNDTIFPIFPEKKPTAIFLGDSFTGGTGASPYHSYAAVLSRLLGWECWHSGSGGTGFLNPGPAGRVKFRDRLGNVLNYNPDIVVVEGGSNDTTYPKADVQAEAEYVLSQLKSGLPNATIIVLGNFAVQGITTAVTDTRDALKAATLKCGLPFIDSVDGVTYDAKGTALMTATGPWITGTGNISSQQATGNASYYTWTDNGHPSEAGHEYIGERLATEIYRLFR